LHPARNLDQIGGGNLVRNLDQIGGGNILWSLKWFRGGARSRWRQDEGKGST
jgi:hypothetical protein